MVRIMGIIFVFLINIRESSEDFRDSGMRIAAMLTDAYRDMTADSDILRIFLEALEEEECTDTSVNAARSSSAQSIADSVEGECRKNVRLMILAIIQREEWALRMLGAFGKPPSGLFNHKLLWLGDWDECLQTKAVIFNNNTLEADPAYSFSGKYCSAQFPFAAPEGSSETLSVIVGICVPSSCNSSDVDTLFRIALTAAQGNQSIPAPHVSCQENKLPLDGQAVAVIVFCGVLLTIMLVATVYDVVYVHWLARTPTLPKTSQFTTNIMSAWKQGVYVVQMSTLQEGKATVKGSACQNVSVLYGKSAQHDLDNMVNSERPEVEDKTDGQKLSAVVRTLLCFSAYKNGTEILGTSHPRGSVKVYHGIRFLTMTWIVIGNAFTTLRGPLIDNSTQYTRDIMTRFEFTPIFNSMIAVDTFFILSGLLVGHQSLRQLKKRRGVKHFPFGVYYFGRVLKIVPPYMLLMLLWVSLDKYLADGPLWPQDGFQRESCRKTWWTNLLFINNFVKDSHEETNVCFKWTWFLAVDMQFYVTSPLVFIPMFYWPAVGGLACVALVAVGAISSAVVTINHQLPAQIAYDAAKVGVYWWDFYVKPWCRVGPFAIGLFTGFMLHRTNMKIKINRYVNVLLWAAAFASALFVVYGMYSPDQEDPLTVTQSALYNATARNVWAICVCWVIFSCSCGYGGPINHLLTWPGFVPLARVNYLVYLSHLILIDIYRMSQRATIHLYDYSAVYITLGHLCMSYATAFVLSLAFDGPAVQLEKAFLLREKK